MESVICTPNKFMLPVFHFSPYVSLNLLCLLIINAWVLSIFVFRPEHLKKLSSSFFTSGTDLMSSNIIVVSSANWLIFIL